MTILHDGTAANGVNHTNGSSKHQYALSTRAIHVGSEPDPVTGAVIPPISLSTTFKQDGVGIHKVGASVLREHRADQQGFEYSRSDNPTRNNLEKMLASLDGGAESIVFSSGSGATAALAQWVTLPVHEGGAGAGIGKGHILSVNDVVRIIVFTDIADGQYGGTYRYLSRVATNLQGIQVDYLDMVEAGEAGIREAIREDTKVDQPYPTSLTTSSSGLNFPQTLCCCFPHCSFCPTSSTPYPHSQLDRFWS